MLKSFKLLIVGDVKRGKTALTSRIIDVLAEVCGEEKITVLDFAPDFGGIGRQVKINSNVKVIRPEGLKAPRLMGKDCDTIWRLAKYNRELTENAIKEYLRNPTPILVINDLSIHLQGGDLSLVFEAVGKAVLFIANSYYGDSLRDDCGLSEWERKLVEEMMGKADYVWRL